MMAFTHIAAGGASALVLSDLLHAQAAQAVLLLAGGVLGGMLPDIDHPASAFGRRVLPVSMTIAAIFGHRGITHSFIAVAAMLFAAWYALHSFEWHPGYSMPFVLGVSAGYLSHLVCDWLANSGVPLLWPMQRRFAAPVTIQTGSPVEYLIAFGLYAWLGAGIVKGLGHA
ncbi:metal-dependent hydrolase [Azovibrio restrictus]|uniref:metal-dependent hydrolase n=1 Tax=Azovibrio restrictus TaxID=146938 RepID=UPI0026F11C68|nr:metal-dependent hydrolase [Azovibrio restrictus]